MEPPIFAQITLSEAELQIMLTKAAEFGARKALNDIGLHDENAAEDVRQLRGLLDSWRDAKETAWKSLISWVVKSILMLLLAGVYFKTWAK
jgi:hypothetical protein